MRRRKIKILIIGLLFGGVACDSEPDSLISGQKAFVKFYGGEFSEEGMDVAEMADGGYLIVGSASSGSDGQNKDILLVKTNAAGETQWLKTIGEEGDDVARRIKPLPDGGYLVVGDYGIVEDSVVNKEIILIKLTAQGDEVWRKTYGYKQDTLEFEDQGRDVAVASDGTYMIVGSTVFQNDMQACFLTTDENGEMIGSVELIGYDDSDDYAISVLPDQIGAGFAYFTGSTEHSQDFNQSGVNIFVASLDADGDRRNVGPIGEGADEYGVRLLYAHDEMLLLLCNREQGVSSRPFLLKLDKNLQPVAGWPKDVVLPDITNVRAENICKTQDGYLVVATHRVSGLDSNIILIKLDMDGGFVWQKPFRSFGGGYVDRGNSVIVDSENRIVVAGRVSFSALEANVKMCLIKTNEEGEIKP